MQNSKFKIQNSKFSLTTNVANASKREQRLLADYAEREHFRADAVWSNVAVALRPKIFIRDFKDVKVFKDSNPQSSILNPQSSILNSQSSPYSSDS